ncbi:MAG: hypothetical protein AB7O66_21775 [Limisphaerales bacterium]
MKILPPFLVVLLAGIVAGPVVAPGQQDQPAQPQSVPRPQQERPAPRPTGVGAAGSPAAVQGFLRMNPLFAALDANADGVIDADEINGAVAALNKLDKNGDGKLTGDELRPGVPRGGRGGTELRDGGQTNAPVPVRKDRVAEGAR